MKIKRSENHSTSHRAIDVPTPSATSMVDRLNVHGGNEETNRLLRLLKFDDYDHNNSNGNDDED